MKTAPILIAFAFMSAVDLLRRHWESPPNLTIGFHDLMRAGWWWQALAILSSALMLVTGLIALMSRISPRPPSLIAVYLLIASAGCSLLSTVVFNFEFFITRGTWPSEFGWIGEVAESIVWSLLWYAALIQLVLLADGPRSRGFLVESRVQPSTASSDPASPD